MKKIKLIGGFVAIVAIVGTNVWRAVDVFKSSELGFEDVEAFGDGGDFAPRNPFRLWFSQGLTADERELPTPCPVTNGHYKKEKKSKKEGSYTDGGFNVSSSSESEESCSYDFSYSGTKIDCPSGYSNCRPIQCGN